jgi:transcriptional regulator with XRE-family HTH domain
MKPMDKAIFDIEMFHMALDLIREERKMNWIQVADATGVSASTLTRIGQGKRPDIDGFIRLLAWSGLKAERFINAPKQKAPAISDRGFNPTRPQD